MALSRSLPDYVLRLRQYGELDIYAQAFAAGHLNLLILCGPPGVGKSVRLRRTVGDQVCWIGGNASAFGIFQQAFERCHQPIILDDVDCLYRDRNGIRLLKALCQTERVKTLSWHSEAKALDRRDIPREFTTTSHVAIIANEWRSLNADIAALEDRGHFLVFEPTPLEVHCHAATWFWDQQIFDFVGAHLHLMAQPSLRTYVLAWELKQANLDWRVGVLSRCLSGTALQVARLKADTSFAREEDRARAFVASQAGSRATYFNYARRQQPKEHVPALQLVVSTPP